MLRKEEEWNNIMKTFFSKAPTGLGVVELIDNDTDIFMVGCNDAAAALSGVKASDLNGKRYSQSKPQMASYIPKWAKQYRGSSGREHSAFVDDFNVVTEHGVVKKYISALLFEVGKHRFAHIVQDITKQKELEDQIKRQNENLENQVRERTSELEAALQVKSRFLAIMSHEMRTPMTGIIGMIALLSESTLTSEQRDLLHSAQLCADQLLLLINDVLDLTKMQENKFCLENKPFSLYDAMQKALEVISFEVVKKESMELVFSMDPKLSVTDLLIGDELRLRQVLINLLSNAVKFSTSGNITLCVELLSEINGKILLQFSVSDQGCGISETAKQHIFQPFMQADDSITRRYGGTGLGLSISKKLVEYMGGNMWFQSELDRGTTFYFTIDTQRVGKSDIQQPTCPDKRILIIGNNGPFGSSLKQLLNSLGFSNVSTSDTQHVTSSAEPQIMLCNGLSALQSAQQSHPKVLTVLMDYQQRSTGHYLKKPIWVQPLMKILNEQTPSSEQNDVVKKKLHPGVKILVAEDNLLNQKVISRLLQSLGYQHVKFVVNGKEAVDEFKANRTFYDIILMDIQMPVLSGIQATEIIRKEQGQERKPPIIGVTANAFPEDIQKYLLCGFSSIITKPIQKELLENTLEQLITNKQSS